MAILAAYLDESGTHGSGSVTAVGGLIGFDSAWTSLEREWQDALRDIGVKTFHAVDCEHGEGEFARIQRPIRRAIVNRLARVIAKHDVTTVWSAVLNQDWDDIVDDDFLCLYLKPFDLCFDYVTQRMRYWCARHAPGYSIALVYSEQREFGDRIRAVWDAYHRSKEAGGLSAFSTSSPRDCVALQAADLFVYEMAKDWRGPEIDPASTSAPPPTVMRLPLQIIRDGCGVDFGGCFNYLALSTAMSLAKAGQPFIMPELWPKGLL
jgi:hypothetical protein